VSLVSSTVDATHPLPENGVIVLQFDRYLNPQTITRQSFEIADAANNPLQGGIVSYDPIALTVTIASPNSATTGTSEAVPWIVAGQSYKLYMPVSGSSTDPAGVRAIDNAPLDPSVGPIEIAFNVVKAGAPPSLPTISFCGDVFPILNAKCATGSPCHTDPGDGPPAASLSLASPEGIAQTAIGRISQASNTSGISGQAIPANRVFGLNFPIIDPGHASTSWLMYKVALAPAPDAITDQPPVCPDVSGKSAAPQAIGIKTSAFPPSDDETQVLSDAILGRPMPYPSYGPTNTYPYAPLTFEERERVRLWIDQGAKVEPCGICGPPMPAAGAGPSSGDGAGG